MQDKRIDLHSFNINVMDIIRLFIFCIFTGFSLGSALTNHGNGTAVAILALGVALYGR